MARDEDRFQRRRRLEREEEQAERTQAAIDRGDLSQVDDSQLLDKIEDLVTRTETMIDKLNSLYRMYFSGFEKLPPTVQRKQLDQQMDALTQMPKPTASHRFRFTTLQARYLAHREKWDKTLRDIENGKIQLPRAGKRAA